MSSGIDITVIGADEAVKIFKNIDAKYSISIKKQVVKSALKIEGSAKRLAPSDTGRLRSTIQTRILSAGFEADIFSDASYAAAVENGSRSHFPPPSALEGWARRHGMEGLEFLIARGIARRGTLPRPFLFPSWEAERPEFITEMKKITKALERG